jgi:hypothetical protein
VLSLKQDQAINSVPFLTEITKGKVPACHVKDVAMHPATLNNVPGTHSPDFAFGCYTKSLRQWTTIELGAQQSTADQLLSKEVGLRIYSGSSTMSIFEGTVVTSLAHLYVPDDFVQPVGKPLEPQDGVEDGEEALAQLLRPLPQEALLENGVEVRVVGGNKGVEVRRCIDLGQKVGPRALQHLEHDVVLQRTEEKCLYDRLLQFREGRRNLITVIVRLSRKAD